MQIDKKLILQHLDSLGKHDEAAQAHDELPDPVDSDTHADILAKFGVNPQDIAAASVPSSASSNERSLMSNPTPPANPPHPDTVDPDHGTEPDGTPVENPSG